MIIGKAVIPGRQAPHVYPVPNNVNDATWKQISEVSIAGIGDTYWDTGDCKAITLNGKIGDYLTLSNTTLYVFILDFNHPINKTMPDNNIIWGGFKTSLTGGKDVALVDSGYGSAYTDGMIRYNINHWGNNNYGGWKGSDLRYDVLGGVSTAPYGYGYNKTNSVTGYDATQETINTPVPNTLMMALPNDLRSVLRLWDRYIDSKGGASNDFANCNKKTVDAISILAEYEIFGSSIFANEYEQDYQKQMAYYSNGNSKIKYKYNDTSTKCHWLTSSAESSATMRFTRVTETATALNAAARYCSGLAPAFKT